MSKKDVFAIFPYLKTTERVLVRGILLRSSDDLEGLSSGQQTHLKDLFAMFFLRENLRIKRMVYAHFELGEDAEANQKLIWRLYDAQKILIYEYATPHRTMGDPFFHKEQTSIYVFTSDKIPTDLIWPRDAQVDYGVENLSKEDVPQEDYIDGYNGVLNGAVNFWVTAGNRIYPPVPQLSLNISQDLGYDLMQADDPAKNWALADFFHGHELKNTELVLFVA